MAKPRHVLKPWRSIVLLTVVLGGITFVSLFVGSVALPPANVLGLLTHRLGLGIGQRCPVLLTIAGYPVSCDTQRLILFQALLPSVLLSLLVGAALGLAGGTMQGVFRNPLGDPYLLGISSGAALGAALAFAGGFALADAEVLVPIAAFAGAMGTGALVLLASRSSRATPETLLLTGVALGSFLGSILALVVSLRPTAESLPLTFWILGGFTAATWGQVGLLAAAVLVGGTALTLHGRVLNLLQLGEETALGLGVPVRTMRWRLILLSVLVTAFAVAFSGIIGFVGLIAPHIVRRLQGPNYRTLLPASALVGAIFLVLANDVATSVLGGGGLLPTGVVTSFVGGPFFLYVLYRRNGRRAV